MHLSCFATEDEIVEAGARRRHIADTEGRDAGGCTSASSVSLPICAGSALQAPFSPEKMALRSVVRSKAIVKRF